MALGHRGGCRPGLGAGLSALVSILGLDLKFGDEEVLEAWDTACKHYDNPVTAISKLGGILYNRSLFSSFIEEA